MSLSYAGTRSSAHRLLLRCVLCVVACGAAAALSAHADDYPRAELARGSRALMAALETRLGGEFAVGLAGAIGGSAAQQILLDNIGDLAASLDVPVVADRAWERALAIAERRGDHAAVLALHTMLGRSATALGDYDNALLHAQRTAELGQRLHDPLAQGQAENMLGILERRRGHLDTAIAHQERARELFAEAGDRTGQARALTDLGTVLRDRGDFAKALEVQLEALTNPGDRIDHIYRNLGLLYRDIEDGTASRGYFEKALAAAEQRGAPPSSYSTLIGSYSSLLNELGEYTKARAAASEALAIDTALDDLPHQGLDHLELGRALLGLREDEAATTHLQQALALGRELRQREIVARSLLHLSEAALLHRDTAQARQLIDDAIAGLEGTRLRTQLAQAYALREQLARSEDKPEEALRYAHKYAQAREELSGIRASRQLAMLEVSRERAEAEHRVTLLAKDNELQAVRIERQALVRDLFAIVLASLALGLGVLVWRHRAVRRLNRELAARNTEIEHQRLALDTANATLRAQASDLLRAATTDPLTQVANRRHLLHCLEERLLGCTADEHSLALMLIDFDHFKRINDGHGHLFGDQVLITGTASMREALGSDDIVGRYGGEEFVAIVCRHEADEVLALAERLRERVNAELARLAPQLDSVATISIGIAFVADLGGRVDAAALLGAADQALYMAKRAGRNCVRRYQATATIDS